MLLDPVAGQFALCFSINSLRGTNLTFPLQSVTTQTFTLGVSKTSTRDCSDSPSSSSSSSSTEGLQLCPRLHKHRCDVPKQAEDRWRISIIFYWNHKLQEPTTSWHLYLTYCKFNIQSWDKTKQRTKLRIFR